MRIVFLTSEYATRSPSGGIANYVRDTALALADRGHLVHVICTNSTNHIEYETDNRVGVTFAPARKLPVRPLLWLMANLPGLSSLEDVRCGWGLLEASLGVWLHAWKIARIDGPIDLFHAPDFGALAFWGLLWPKHRTPIVLRGHGYLNLDKAHVRWCGARFQHRLELFCLRHADFVIANSRFLEQQYVNNFHLRRNRVGFLPTGFNVVRHPHHRSSLRQEEGWLDDTPIVVYVGRIEFQKGCDLLFDALLRCRNDGVELGALFIGSVAEAFRGELQCFLEQTKSWSRFLGPVSSDEVAAWLGASDLLVLPSRGETFGRVVIEANLQGLPVVATNIDALSETVEDGVTGVLVAPNDVDALANAISMMCTSTTRRVEMGKCARQRAVQRFDFASIIEKQVAIYRALARRESPWDEMMYDRVNG